MSENHNDDDRTESLDNQINRSNRPRIERLGQFRIESTLGSGGMGTIYRAFDESMKRPVALKVLHTALEISKQAQTRFVREAWIAGQLDHPNIVKVYSRGEENKVSYLAMELVDGGSLYDYIERTRESIPSGSDVTATIDQDYINDILGKFIELAGALEHIHNKGFIHRDIKPHNVLLSGEEKKFKFTDFGIAHAEDMTRMTRAGDFIGTVKYMSPELLAAHRAGIDKRTDIYSLGVTLYEALTLTLPFKAESEERLIGEILAGHYHEARKSNRRIPVDLETVLMKACNHDPVQRYQTAAEFADDLQRIIDGRPILAKRPGLVTKCYKYVCRNYKTVLGIAAASTIVVLAVLWAYYKVEQAYRDTSGQQPMVQQIPEPKFARIDIPGKTEYCALSPDGKQIAFVAKDKCLWVAPTHGLSDSSSIGEPIRLTEPIAPNTLGSIPTWSADGKWIAFNGKGNNGDRWADTLAIYVVSSSGGELRRLPILHDLWDAYFDLRISLSPDGKEVAFFSHTSPVTVDTIQNCIYTMSVSGGEIRRLAGPSCGQPAYSPDGKMLAYVKGDLQPWAISDSLESDIWVIPVKGGEPIRVSNIPGVVFSPTWSPDSRMITFGKWEDFEDSFSIKRLYFIRLSDMYEPIGEPVEIELPMWWDGYHLCGWSGQNNIGILLWSPSKRNEAIYKVAASGGIATKATSESGFAPKWSPNGEKIFYIINDSIRFIPSQGGAISKISILDNLRIRPWDWDISADGKKLIFPASIPKDSMVSIYTVPVSGGSATSFIVNDTISYISPYYSPDGRCVSFQSYYKSEIRLCVIPSEGGEIRELVLVMHGDCQSLPHKAWSPDSRRIAFASCSPDSSHSISVVSLDGGDPETLYQLPRGYFINSIDWSPDGKHLCYTTGLRGQYDGREGFDIWILSLETKKTIKLQTGLELEWVDEAEWSPDGNHILFHCDWSGSSDFYLMDNILPSITRQKSEPKKEPTFAMINVPGLLDYCALSFDGKKIAYATDDSCLWVAPTRGLADPKVAGESVRLTDPIISYPLGCLPVWSADGNWIGFNADNHDSAGSYWSSMYVISSTGSEVYEIPVRHDRKEWLTFYDYRLSLSPDGKEVAFYSYTSPIPGDSLGNCIYVMPVKGGKIRRLVDLPQGDSAYCAHPAFSPDGKLLAFLRGNSQCGLAREEADCDIWVIPAKGGEALQVTDFPGVEFGPVWSPNGRNLVYCKWSGLEGQSGYDVKEIEIIELNDQYKPKAPPIKIILPLPADDFISGWSTDEEIGLVSETEYHKAIYTVSADGGVATMVRPSSSLCPNWSKYGDSIYYISHDKICTSPLSEDRETILPISGLERMGYEGGCDLSHDGKSLAFNGGITRESVLHIFTASTQGGIANQLTYDSEQDWYPRWSPDDKWIAFSRTVPNVRGACDLYIVSVDGKELKKLVSWSDSLGYADHPVDWSPDGDYIAYPSIDQDSIRGISIISTIDGNTELLLELEPGLIVGSLRWSPDGSKIAYTVASTGYNKHADVWILPLDTRKPKMLQVLADLDAVVRVDWSPDGRRLAFVGVRLSKNTLCLIKDFLPDK